MATPRFDNRVDLQRWLGDQPKPVCVAIAARAAMRAVMVGAPTLNARDANQRTAILSPIFRVTAAPWVAAHATRRRLDLARGIKRRRLH